MISSRLAVVRRKMADRGLNGLLVTSRQNVFYLSGFDGSSGDLFITLDAAYIMCDFRYTQQAQQQASMYMATDVSKGIYHVINNIISYHKLSQIGVEDRSISQAVYHGMKKSITGATLVSIGGLITEMRMIKDELEVENLEKAAWIGDLAFQETIKKIRPGISEIEIAAELEYVMRKNGASGTSFDTIVASGINSAKPHGTASDKLLEDGDFVVMDFGCIYNGYCSDMTRTVAIGGVSPEQQKVYQAVLFTQLKMVNQVSAGKPCVQLDHIARNLLNTFGYSEYFGHSLGHGVGIDIHEAPTLGPKSQQTLEPGMLVTIEPGVYFADNFGVRIEDSVLVLEDEIKILTHSPKELMIL